MQIVAAGPVGVRLEDEPFGADPHDRRRAARGTRAGSEARARRGVSAPDLVAPVIAFRSWRLAGAQLVSPFIPCRWEGRVMHASCYDANRTLMHGVGWLDAPHASPHADCQCGIYAYHTPGPRSWFGEAYWCEGVVSAWGRLVVHQDGFRAEHARVEALAVPDGMRPLHVREAADALGVPLIAHDALEDYAAALGGGVPPSLRP